MKTPPPFLQLHDISASYDNSTRVVDGVSFSLLEGELACLLGPSGCGKTTVLRSIAGFHELQTGQIVLDNKTLAQNQQGRAIHHLNPEARGVGMVFQDHALFPHLNIADNISFGLNRLAKSERRARVAHLLELIGMAAWQHRYPHELSGGQSQRVALARAIAPRPKLLLLDEPFSNLDSELRESLGHEVRGLLKELEITAIMVTHDQHDAFALGDKVGVMQGGQLMQWGNPFDLYHAPQNRFVANFIGDGVFVKGELLSANTVVTNFGEVRGTSADPSGVDALLNKQVELLIRPDDVIYDPNSALRGEVVRKAFKGAQTLYTLEMKNGERLLSLVPSHDDYEIGDVIGISIEADHLVCFEST